MKEAGFYVNNINGRGQPLFFTIRVVDVATNIFLIAGRWLNVTF
jgi:hypothetical protein